MTAPASAALVRFFVVRKSIDEPLPCGHFANATIASINAARLKRSKL
jgi:hypothetical protein